MARKLACLFYRLLQHGQPYVDKGTQYYESRYREQQIRSLLQAFTRAFCSGWREVDLSHSTGTVAVAGVMLAETGFAGAALNAAMPAAQAFEAPSDALAQAVPAVACIESSTISFVFGAAGTVSSIV
jgi:hypothetical protein